MRKEPKYRATVCFDRELKKEAEKIFNAFDKVPASIWEEETNKYQNVLEAYKDIKVMRWIENDKSNVKEEVTDTK